MNWIHWRLQTISPPPPPPLLPPPLPVSLYKSELEAQVSLWVNFAAFLRWHLPPAKTFWGHGREEDAADDEVKVTGQSRTDDVFLNKFSVQNSGFYSIKELYFLAFCDLHPREEPFNLRHVRAAANVDAAQPPAPGGPGQGVEPTEPRSTTQVTPTELYAAQIVIQGASQSFGAIWVNVGSGIFCKCI